MNTLNPAVLDWALGSLQKNGDNSLFRPPFEFCIIEESWSSLRDTYAEIDLTSYQWSPARQFLFPKDSKSFRRATQLDPLDSIVFTAIMKEIGPRIESTRLPDADNTVFSFRFDTEGASSLYRSEYGWNEFWRTSKDLADAASQVVRTDISAFYRQVSHEMVADQLEGCEVPATYTHAILELLKTSSSDSNRGIPIGPHAAHLLAELSLTSFDNLFSARGYRFTRYIDDIHVFCPPETHPQTALFDIADVLDQLGLSLNQSKTQIFSRTDFVDRAKLSLQESSVSAKEERMLEIINAVTDDDYDFASFQEACKISDTAFSQETIEAIFEESFSDTAYIDYPHLGWILRRLAQVGAPGGIEYVVANLQQFIPVIGDAALYLAASKDNYDSSWPELGDRLLGILQMPIVERSDYLQMIVVGLFSQVKELNHVDKLTQRFWDSSSPVRREIVLATAGIGGRKQWLYSLEKQVADFDPWLRRAFALSVKTLAPSWQKKCLETLRRVSAANEHTLVEAIINGPSPMKHDSKPGKASSRPRKKPTAFISYAHSDEAVVSSLIEKLESERIEVWLDTRSMEASESISAFVKRAVASTDRTILVVSRKSLLSSWVGLETLRTFAEEEVYGRHRLIACSLDDAFLQRDFVLKAVDSIDSELKEIARLMPEYDKKNLDTVDLNDEKSRLYLLRANLGRIVSRLKKSLTLDIRGEKFQENIQRLVSEVKGGDGR